MVLLRFFLEKFWSQGQSKERRELEGGGEIKLERIRSKRWPTGGAITLLKVRSERIKTDMEDNQKRKRENN